MPKARQALPEGTKLDYTTIDGTPKINIATVLTTRAQVDALVEQLEKLMAMLPEAKARKVKPKAKATARAKNGNKEEELFGKAHD